MFLCESYCWFHPQTKDRHDDKTHLLGLGADKEVEDRESIGSGHGGSSHLLLHFVHFTLSLVLTTHHGGNVGLSLFHFHGGSILDDDGLLGCNEALSSKRRGRGGCGPGIDGAEGNCCREDEENSGRGVHCYLLCRVFLDCNPLHSNTIDSRFLSLGFGYSHYTRRLIEDDVIGDSQKSNRVSELFLRVDMRMPSQKEQ